MAFKEGLDGGGVRICYSIQNMGIIRDSVREINITLIQ